ncbi:MAG: trypsin-like peptidase domain-containing protein [Bifidobacteriaceae bacterium]|nr:trypsin-like peptidase domain-containing protein [Bifidobacteriaceae bacterium]
MNNFNPNPIIAKEQDLTPFNGAAPSNAYKATSSTINMVQNGVQANATTSTQTNGTSTATLNSQANTPAVPVDQYAKPKDPTVALSDKNVLKVAGISTIASILAFSLILMIAAHFGFVNLDANVTGLSKVGKTTSAGEILANRGLDSANPDWAVITANNSPAVVSITNERTDKQVVAGSGFFIDKEGRICTNAHVVYLTKALEVTLSSGQILEAKLIGMDESTDVAIIQLTNTPADLTFVEFADSDDLVVGDQVLAIGNPHNLANTATTGIVSALDRPVTTQTEDGTSLVVNNTIQTDASINQGNSGGPLFNWEGKVIGINSAIETDGSGSTGSIGLGFAIPSNHVKKIKDELIQNGNVKHALLGVSLENSETQVGDIKRVGAKVATITEGDSAAGKAGMKVGDVIVEFNGKVISDTYALMGYVRALSPNTEVEIKYVRDGKLSTVKVTLTTAPDKPVAQQTTPSETEEAVPEDSEDEDLYSDSMEEFFKKFYGMK